MNAGSRVCAVLVTYRPELQTLQRALDSVRAQVSGVVIVDNASQPPLPETFAGDGASASLEILRMPFNAGLAAAQNRGIAHARERSYTHVLLLDQDSIPAPDMISQLLAAECALLARGESVAAVGPQIEDARSGRPHPFCQLRGPIGRTCRTPADAGGADSCDTFLLIASGSLIRLGVLEEVGPFEVQMFIDNVDLEWCFRAADQGYRCFGIFAGRMEHALGDRTVALAGRRLVLHVHSPQRIYYMTRNRLWLYRRSYVPLGWKCADLPRFLAKFLLYMLFVRPRAANLRSFCRGIGAGLLGRAGEAADAV